MGLPAQTKTSEAKLAEHRHKAEGEGEGRGRGTETPHHQRCEGTTGGGGDRARSGRWQGLDEGSSGMCWVQVPRGPRGG